MPHESFLVGKVKAMTTIALNVLDELYLHLDRDAEPWSVQLEVVVEGRVGSDRLADAIVEGARRHPLARARLRPARGIDFGYEWEVADELAEAPLEVADCDDDAALAMAREALMSTSPDLDEAPPFAITLAHHPGGAAIMLNLNHAARGRDQRRAADGLDPARIRGRGRPAGAGGPARGAEHQRSRQLAVHPRASDAQPHARAAGHARGGGAGTDCRRGRRRRSRRLSVRA